MPQQPWPSSNLKLGEVKKQAWSQQGFVQGPWLTSNLALGVLSPGHTLVPEFPVSQVGRAGGGSRGEGGACVSQKDS